MDNNDVALALGGLIATLGIFIAIIGFVWWILQIVAKWKIFTKAGKPGWHSIIPILSDWDVYDLSWSRLWAWIWLALTIVNGIVSKDATAAAAAGESYTPGAVAIIAGIALFVIALIDLYKLAKAFGRGFGFFLGLVFLNPIFMLILGFGSDQYQGRQG